MPNVRKTLDQAIKTMDADPRESRALESIKKLANGLQKSDDVLYDFKVMQMTASQIKDKKLKAEADNIVRQIEDKLRKLMK